MSEASGVHGVLREGSLLSGVLLAGRVLVGVDAGREVAIDDGGVLIERGVVRFVGPRAEVIAAARGAPQLIDAPRGLLMPGLVDAHTHAAWVGSRHGEYEVRLRGEGYEAIARAGGGIRSTMRAVREASVDELSSTLRSRLRRMAACGVTTVEVKSGYGLDREGERKQLDAIADAASDPSLPRVVPTYLALHAIAPEHDGDRAGYVAMVERELLPEVAAAGLARFVDAYVDRSAFTVDEATRVLSRARSLGLGVRLHAGQFADVGAATLAASLGAASADHLEHVSSTSLDEMARAGTRAVLLPVASWVLGQQPPPVAEMRRAGVELVVASDANPGTAPTESLPLAMAMAARVYGLSRAEVLAGVTTAAAASVGVAVGTIEVGSEADLALFELPHESALLQPWGRPPLLATIGRGRLLVLSAR